MLRCGPIHVTALGVTQGSYNLALTKQVRAGTGSWNRVFMAPEQGPWSPSEMCVGTAAPSLLPLQCLQPHLRPVSHEEKAEPLFQKVLRCLVSYALALCVHRPLSPLLAQLALLCAQVPCGHLSTAAPPARQQITWQIIMLTCIHSDLRYIKLLEENTGKKFLDLGLGMTSSRAHQKHRQPNESKHMAFHETKELPHSKENIQSTERATRRMREPCIFCMVNIQNT